MQIKAVTRQFLEKNILDFTAVIANWKYCSWNVDNFMYELPKKWEFSFAFYADTELAGFCFASNKIETVYYIHLLFISDNFRGKSLGAEMITHCKKIAMGNGIRKIELRCPESNTGALAFYTRTGFSVVQKIKDETSGHESDFYLKLDI